MLKRPQDASLQKTTTAAESESPAWTRPAGRRLHCDTKATMLKRMLLPANCLQLRLSIQLFLRTREMQIGRAIEHPIRHGPGQEDRRHRCHSRAAAVTAKLQTTGILCQREDDGRATLSSKSRRTLEESSNPNPGSRLVVIMKGSPRLPADNKRRYPLRVPRILLLASALALYKTSKSGKPVPLPRRPNNLCSQVHQHKRVARSRPNCARTSQPPVKGHNWQYIAFWLRLPRQLVGGTADVQWPLAPRDV